MALTARLHDGAKRQIEDPPVGGDEIPTTKCVGTLRLLYFEF